MSPKAFITGVSGQDGRHLAPYLHQNGYDIAGLVRGQDFEKRELLEKELPYAKLYEGDITDFGSLIKALADWKPDEVYHLAAISFVPLSWVAPSHVLEVNVIGTVNILEAVKGIAPGAKIVIASSSEVFGNVPIPQSETSPMKPVSVYGLSKLTDLHLTRQYRDHYGMFACAAISSNHESPLRPPCFVTRKVTRSMARIEHGLQDKIEMGNLKSKRDWGYSLDYMVGMHEILQQSIPKDFVLGTGISHSVGELLQEAYSCTLISRSLDDILEQRDIFLRPEDVSESKADPREAYKVLGWRTETSFEKLIEMMMDYDSMLCEGSTDAMAVRSHGVEIRYPGRENYAVQRIP